MLFANLSSNSNEEKEEELKIPFNEFFDNYFRDESGNLPSNFGSRFYFIETMASKDWGKFIKKAGDIEQKNNFEFNLSNADVVIDTTITGNFGGGVFLVVGDKPILTLKDISNDWRTVKNLTSFNYDEDDKRLYIKEYEFLIHSEDRPLVKRLAECFKAYFNQNQAPKANASQESELTAINHVLDKIDSRIEELEAKREKLLAFENEE